jgi:hypothetical protein
MNIELLALIEFVLTQDSESTRAFIFTSLMIAIGGAEGISPASFCIVLC